MVSANTSERIYLDHAATTAVDPRVVDVMLPALAQSWGNPSSIYREGQEARRLLDEARDRVAAILGAQAAEIVFTAGGSEADNWAIRGAAYAMQAQGRHIVTTAIEHHAVLHTCERLEREGFAVTFVPVDAEGFVTPEQVADAVRDDTTVVSVMYANNEVGTIEPIAAIARAVKARNPRTVVHTDAVQAAGALSLNVDRLGVDALSLAAHKFYGPKGSGVLYLRTGTPFLPQLLGGAQEKDRRAGTENVAGAAGLAAALSLAYEEFEQRTAHSAALRDRLLDELPRRVPYTHVNGPRDGARRIANNASFCFEFIEGEALLLALDLGGIAASSGSACTSGSLEPSHVLRAMGVPDEIARSSLRLSVGKENTPEQIARVLDAIPRYVERLRALSPLGPETPDSGALAAGNA
ncbi:MAG TPA: cysteine desulfurase family protein [Dehalococcoidia bacterium]|nr:cysteine desulfurase family protein [Dehalococcoidia bacterium]